MSKFKEKMEETRQNTLNGRDENEDDEEKKRKEKNGKAKEEQNEE